MKLKYNGKKLIDSGELNQSFERLGMKVNSTQGGQTFIETRTGLKELKVVRNTVKIDNVELEAFLKRAKALDKYLEVNKEIFVDDTVDSFEKIMNYVETYSDNILVVGENIYMYNGIYYELLDFNSLENTCYSLIREVTIPEEKLVDKAVYFAYKEFVMNGRHYDMRFDYSYNKAVRLAFNDGTLEITKNGIKFLNQVWEKEHNLFFKFDLNYLELEESNGIVEKWFDIRFFNQSDRMVSVACIGDLFITNNFSQCMLYLYGAGGTGKSLLQESFSALLNKGATSTVNINDVGSQFKSAPLFRSAINFSSEISRKAVNSDKFKTIIARDEETLSLKFKNDCKGRPLAKWLSVANSLPTIDMDSGVKRRLLAIEVTDTLIMEHNDLGVSKSEFEQLFFNDKRGMLNIIIEGITNLFNYGFDLSTMYKDFIGNEYMGIIVNLNDNVAFFMDYATEKKDDTGKENLRGILKSDLFEAFEEFRKMSIGSGISLMKSQTFYARVKELLYKDKRVQYRTEVNGEKKKLNSAPFYNNLRFKDSFLKELSDVKNFMVYDVEVLKNPRIMIANEQKEDKKSGFSGKKA